MLKALGNVGPVLGGLILFASWVLQQSLLQQVTHDLETLAHAEAVYQTYQSNNAVFNALIELAPGNGRVDRMRRLQVYNYELGLREMDKALSLEERHDIPEAPQPYSGDRPLAELMTQTQSRLQRLQGHVQARRTSLSMRRAHLGTLFLAMYAFGTTLALAGSLAKAVDAVRPRP
jgi:hypothetical protein